MPRVPRLPFLLLIAGAALFPLDAQQNSNQPANVAARPFAFILPFIPPVSGSPVTVEYAVKVERPPVAGAPQAWRSVVQVARDSNGRIWHELHEYLPQSSTANAKLLFVVFTDPIARLSHLMTPADRIDDRQWYHLPQPGFSDPAKWPGINLGNGTVDGFAVTGKLRTWTTRRWQDDSGQRSRVVDVTWYSNDLRLIVFERQTDSSGGVLTISMSLIDRHEPPASLFKVPRGYHLPVPPPPPCNGCGGPPFPGPGYPGWPSGYVGWSGPLPGPEIGPAVP
jgi:hypothetical protein